MNYIVYYNRALSSAQAEWLSFVVGFFERAGKVRPSPQYQERTVKRDLRLIRNFTWKPFGAACPCPFSRNLCNIKVNS
jgi:hypothetical protein